MADTAINSVASANNNKVEIVLGKLLTVVEQEKLEQAEGMIDVFVKDDEVKTDSLTIAKVFGKEHSKVIRDVREVNCSEDFRQANFGQSDYINKQSRRQIKYDITFDGFIFLVMGYTGKLAGHIKEVYINKFNEMKNELVSQTPSYQIDDPIKRAKQWIVEEEQRQKLIEENKVLELETAQKSQIIGELKPRADYTELVLDAKEAITVTQIAKDYGESARWLNQILNEQGVQYKINGQWVLYAKYHDRGFTKSETYYNQQNRLITSTKWTQKGRLFIYGLLKHKLGILPIIEQDYEDEDIIERV